MISGSRSSSDDPATTSTALLSAVSCSWGFVNKGVLSFGPGPRLWPLPQDGLVMTSEEEVVSEAGGRLG